MRGRDYDVFARRPSLSAPEKARAIASLPVPPLPGGARR
jgi:hypothetical protein